MAKKRFLIMCDSDPNTDPRPNRMIRFLKEDYRVTVLAQEAWEDEDVESVTMSRPRLTLLGKLKRVLFYKLRMYDRLLWSQDLREKQKRLQPKAYDVIITHDLHLIPFALEVGNGAKILFDAREYYPRHFEDQLLWRFVCQRFNEYLCEVFLQKCDKVITVSAGIAKEYQKEYKVQAEVVKSVPCFHDISPSSTEKGKLRIIHHGRATPSRRIECMIRMMDHLDQRFTMDLMLIPADNRYYQFLEKETKKRKNVRIIPAVPYKTIIPFTKEYDIGLFLCKPVTFNLKYALPNKFFEFIQARLAVAIGPSVEMKPIVEQYDCGVVSTDFEPTTLAWQLNGLAIEEVKRLKGNSHKAARALNCRVTRCQVKRIVADLIDGSEHGDCDRLSVP